MEGAGWGRNSGGRDGGREQRAEGTGAGIMENGDAYSRTRSI